MNFTIKKISIPVKNQFMNGTIFLPNSKKRKLPGIVIFHGRGSSQNRLIDQARELAKAGFATLIFSFRGCGKSDGSFKDQTTKMGHEDALAGYDFLLKQKNIDKNKIGVWGISYGGYHASILIKDRNIKSLLLSVPGIYRNEDWNVVPELSKSLRRKYRSGNSFSNNKAIKIIKKYPNSLLLIQHEFDDVCPRKQTEAFFKNATSVSKKEIATLEGLDHRLIGEQYRFESNKLTVDWFKKTL